jgi:hypothetical protein
MRALGEPTARGGFAQIHLLFSILDELEIVDGYAAPNLLMGLVRRLPNDLFIRRVLGSRFTL